MKWLSLAAGGVAGTFARYWVGSELHRRFGAAFPIGTLAVNLSGCLLIGLLAALAEGKLRLGPNARMLLMVGFCGAYTTFSTFMLESAMLARNGQAIIALANLLISVALGFTCFHIGVMLGGLI